MSNKVQQTPAAKLRVFTPPDGAAPESGELAAAIRLCRALLDVELQFYSRLESLLTKMATANLFSTEAATSLSRQIDDLQRERDEMSRDRLHCQQTLASVLQRPAGEVRMSDLEDHLPSGDRAEFRYRRLQVVSRVEGMQRLLRRTDMLLTSRHYLFSDLITALTGQSPSANCYGADGRREAHVPVSVTQAIS